MRAAFYVQPTGTEMMTYGARSLDNGWTWCSRRRYRTSRRVCRKLPAHALSRSWIRGAALLTVILAMDREDVDRKIEEQGNGDGRYVRYRLLMRQDISSTNRSSGGRLRLHPLEGLYLGKNAIFLGDLGCRPIRTKQGHIIVPTQMTLLNSEGNLENYGNGWDFYQCLMLIGTWKEDHRISWTVSEPIPADYTRTVRGLYEPTLAEMPDGRILCVMRGSNGLKNDPEYKLPSHKWYCVSTDGGFHWSKPEPWHYSNGKDFFSPSSMSQIIQHSNGRYFWIGNISPANCQGNAPRWPLVLGEIDPESMMLIEESVITLIPRVKAIRGTAIVQLCL